MSLIFDGVFDRFPTLRIVFVEHAFTWILPLMWRMDAIYEARKSWLDIKRKPSEYVKDHIKFTTQPLDYPEDRTELLRAFDWMECDKILLFSSDYPHWTFDDPRWLVKSGSSEDRCRSEPRSVRSSCQAGARRFARHYGNDFIETNAFVSVSVELASLQLAADNIIETGQ
jgi:predicted TIM-barrel fold metal-dependent hydrolase